MLALGGEVESLIQKEYESYTLHLILYTRNLVNINASVEKWKYNIFWGFLT